jgi:hypothetical protein
MQHDVLDDVVESDETDNNWAHQYIFSPLWLDNYTPFIREAPPNRYGGWSSIVDGSVIDINCDGFRFASTGWWNVVTVRALDPNDDYDCSLYNPSTGSEDGFTGSIGGSYHGSHSIDAVVVNRNVTGTQEWDVGVENYSGGASAFVVEKVISQSFASGDSIVVHFDEGEYLKIWDTYIYPADAGWLSAVAEGYWGANEPITISLFAHTFAYGGLGDVVEERDSDDRGHACLHHNFAGGSYYGLVVRRPQASAGAPMDITLKLTEPKPDVTPARPSGWSAPFVPRPLPDGVPTWVPAPDTLIGFTADTYFNLAFENFSPVIANPVWISWYVDGQTDLARWISQGLMNPFEVVSYNNVQDAVIPGGRHTFTYIVDPTDEVDEIFETNNIYGEQFCFSPLEIIEGNAHTKTHPPYQYGGWGGLPWDVVPQNNCDGYRIPRGSGWWQGMALSQGPNHDYDMELYEKLSGTKEGFKIPLAGSYWMREHTDYVLVNHNILGSGAFDVGILNAEIEGSEYTVQTATSQILAVGSGGTFGPYSLPASRMLQLWDIYLEADVYTFTLINHAGSVDWGMNLHPADLAFQGRIDVLPGGASWQNWPGGSEWISVSVPTAGWYCLAVYKAGPTDIPLSGEYRLRVARGAVGVPGDDRLPAVTDLTNIFPNPFNPQTTIAFELSATGPVDLAVYDLQGALVRRLIQAELPAGRHETVWDGTDDAGQRVASGIYMSRLEANRLARLRKMVMLK